MRKNDSYLDLIVLGLTLFDVPSVLFFVFCYCPVFFAHFFYLLLLLLAISIWKATV